jgi:hypothetical protein
MGGDSAGSESLLWGLRETRNAVARAMEAYNNALTNARKELQPYREAGGQGINALSAALTPEGGMSQTDMVSGLPPGAGADLMNYLTQTPAYQFPLQEGINALDRSAASKGMLLSGAQQKGINQYGQNFALSNALAPAMANYQAYLKNIAGLSGIGQTAATTTGGYDIRTGELIGGSQLAMAQMQNALAGGIATNAMGQQRMDYMQSLTQPNIGSTLGTIAGLPWGQIGNSLSGLFGNNPFAGATATGGLTSSYS